MQMTLQAGIVCSACSWLNDFERATCEDCGNELILLLDQAAGDEPKAEKTSSADQEPTSMETALQGDKKQGWEVDDIADEGPTLSVLHRDLKEGSTLSVIQEAEEKPMEQARHFVCKSCYSPVPSGHKFCGKCGTAAENPAGDAPDYFGDMQTPGKAKLILIKGEGMDGISYHLNSKEHLAGRSEGAILFTEDKWLSPKHANFYYQDEKLVVRDEGSVNGIFICTREGTPVAGGTVFMAGEQVLQVEAVEEYNDEPVEDGTYFFSSPRREPSFRVIQLLEGGGAGMIVHAKDGKVELGREGADMNFPNDPYISSRHLKIEMSGGNINIVDLGSKNGTFIRISGETALVHGDYLFIGKQLLRVEITN